ncbi:MAG: DMT family protein [Phycisphaerales bacterium]|nr:DMT family protein [Phycisphaerales bacterium]
MLRASATICLLFVSNIFMTWAWYGHLKKFAWTLPVAIGLSWLIALPEYTLQVPANRLGHYQHGGPFTAAQLKILQEAITLVVFIGFAIVILDERPRVQEYIAFGLILVAVMVAMSGRRNNPQPGASGALAPPTVLAPGVGDENATPEGGTGG